MDTKFLSVSYPGFSRVLWKENWKFISLHVTFNNFFCLNMKLQIKRASQFRTLCNSKEIEGKQIKILHITSISMFHKEKLLNVIHTHPLKRILKTASIIKVSRPQKLMAFNLTRFQIYNFKIYICASLFQSISVQLLVLEQCIVNYIYLPHLIVYEIAHNLQAIHLC